MSDIAIIILAAGGSTRMGSPKQLLDFGGMPLLRRAAETALAAACGPVIAVLGAQSDTIAGALDGLPVGIARNARWEEGMGTSIQAGLSAIGDARIDGAILMLADQPLITADHLTRLIAAQSETGRGIVAARYAGTVGVPVLFMKPFFGELLALAPAAGCKGVILRHRDSAELLDLPEAEADVDTPEEFQHVLRRCYR